MEENYFKNGEKGLKNASFWVIISITFYIPGYIYNNVSNDQEIKTYLDNKMHDAFLFIYFFHLGLLDAIFFLRGRHHYYLPPPPVTTIAFCLIYAPERFTYERFDGLK